MKYVLIVLAVFLVGCNTAPTPNMDIADSESVTIIIITNNDKVILGDDATLNDDDGGQTPSLGL